MNQMTCVTFVVAIGAITALLVGSVVAVTQPIRVHAQDTWESTLTTHDVPKQYTKVSSTLSISHRLYTVELREYRIVPSLSYPSLSSLFFPSTHFGSRY